MCFFCQESKNRHSMQEYRSLLNSTSQIGAGGTTVLFCKRLIYCKLVLQMSAIT